MTKPEYHIRLGYKSSQQLYSNVTYYWYGGGFFPSKEHAMLSFGAEFYEQYPTATITEIEITTGMLPPVLP